ncbi:MAG: hypothetical protein KIT76_00995 [Pseudolabrys sp.]|nr:hypothetical protein [Pseudolabrys sp.]MCW5696133.1 hypothetical protein [Bauldia sp.]
MAADESGVSNKPSHIAYFVKDGAERSFWTECGVAWPHKDGRGFRLKLDAVPVGGVIELRVNEPSARKQSDSDPTNTEAL